jgi:spore coat protein CotH
MLDIRFRACLAALTVVAVLALVGVAPVAQAPISIPTADAAFFADTVLQDIYLEINTKDWETLKVHYLENDYYPAAFKWNTTTVRNVGIRSRGTGSRSGGKPGLRVDFDRYTTGQKFLGLKSFILRNQTQDASNMHERIAMQLFRRVGLPAASREAHARVFVTNKYAGLYSIVESVDKAFLKNIFGEDEGWLYKYDYNTTDLPYLFEDRGTDPALYVPHPFKPETNESDSRPEKIAEIVRIINHDSDAIFRQTIADYIDLSKLMQHIAVEVFVADEDGFTGDYGMNNFYLYRFRDKNLFTVIAWDKSEAFKQGPRFSIFRNTLDAPPSKRNRLIERAFTYPDLRNVFYDTLLACARSAMSTEDATTPGEKRGWMEREVEREYAQIKDAARADTEKPFTNDDFEAAVEALRVFSRERADFVTKNVADARASNR